MRKRFSDLEPGDVFLALCFDLIVRDFYWLKSNLPVTFIASINTPRDVIKGISIEERLITVISCFIHTNTTKYFITASNLACVQMPCFGEFDAKNDEYDML